MPKNKKKKEMQKKRAATKRSNRAKQSSRKVGSTKKISTEQSLLNRLEPFTSPVHKNNLPDIIQNSWGSVFFIARGKSAGNSQYNIVSRGTGFLVSPYRMITAAHCISDPDSSDNPIAQHVDGDIYFLVSRNGSDRGGVHRVTMPHLKIGKNLHLYPEIDLAVIELPAEFYSNGKTVFKHPDDYLKLAASPPRIGESVCVIGYPFQELKVNTDGTSLVPNSIFVRTDAGVINTCYKNMRGVHISEFTISFNPGNSGGPIIEIDSGKVTAWVRGFNSFEVNINVEGGHQKFYANYSVGIATTNLIDIADRHKIRLF